jgi:hypothetical protein
MKFIERMSRLFNQTSLEFSKDYELICEFYAVTKDKEFTADDFRELGLLKKLDNPRYEARSFFGRMRQNGLIEPTGVRVKSRTPSNLSRKIPIHRWTEKANKLFAD